MNSLQTHPSVILAWDQANNEAWRCGSSTIEPLHFLIGVLLIIDGLYGENSDWVNESLSLLKELRDISSKCLYLLELNEEEVTTLRRNMQTVMHLERYQTPTGLLHRSTALKELFHNASGTAIQEGNNILSLNHLIQAILKSLPARLTELPAFLMKLKTKKEKTNPPTLAQLKNALEVKIMGQNESIDQIIKVFEGILLEVIVHKESNKVLLFYGPPGSGKFVAADVIAEEFFPRRNQILTINLLEYSQDEDSTRLRDALNEFVRYEKDRPFLSLSSVKLQGAILLKNVESASTIVQKFITKILEHNDYTDIDEKSVVLRNYIIILTANSNNAQSNQFASVTASRFCQYFVKFESTDLDSFDQYFDELYSLLEDDLLKINVHISIDESSRMNTILFLSEIARDKQSFHYVFAREIYVPIKNFLSKNKSENKIVMVWSPRGLIITKNKMDNKYMP